MVFINFSTWGQDFVCGLNYGLKILFFVCVYIYFFFATLEHNVSM